jgi:hypothetical protein
LVEEFIPVFVLSPESFIEDAPYSLRFQCQWAGWGMTGEDQIKILMTPRREFITPGWGGVLESERTITDHSR